MTPPSTNVLRVSIILDGDGDRFAQEYYAGGEVGGRRAAIELRGKVQQMVARKRNVEVDRVQITIGLVFCNAFGLAKHHQLTEDRYLDKFKAGFNACGWPMLMSDAGRKAESADEQVKAHIEGQALACDVLVLGGTHDRGYANTIERLQPDLRQKIIFLRATALPFAPTLAALHLDEGRVEGLFASSTVPPPSSFFHSIPPFKPTTSQPRSPPRPRPEHRASSPPPPWTPSDDFNPWHGDYYPPSSPSSSPPSDGWTPPSPPTNPHTGTGLSSVSAKYQPLVDFLRHEGNSAQTGVVKRSFESDGASKAFIRARCLSYEDLVDRAVEDGVVKLGEKNGLEWVLLKAEFR